MNSLGLSGRGRRQSERAQSKFYQLLPSFITIPPRQSVLFAEFRSVYTPSSSQFSSHSTLFIETVESVSSPTPTINLLFSSSTGQIRSQQQSRPNNDLTCRNHIDPKPMAGADSNLSSFTSVDQVNIAGAAVQTLFDTIAHLSIISARLASSLPSKLASFGPPNPPAKSIGNYDHLFSVSQILYHNI